MLRAITAFRDFSEYGEANKSYSSYNLSPPKNAHNFISYNNITKTTHCYMLRALLVHNQGIEQIV
jgi:hypothetical protein